MFTNYIFNNKVLYRCSVSWNGYNAFFRFETKYYDKVIGGCQSAKILFPMCGNDIHMKWYVNTEMKTYFSKMTTAYPKVINHVI